ncbi:fructose-6-phosphate aldolase [candidate division KSB1 bacterium]|nr:fructose-6-phosphate aldolase [candidate division KSB1 bacterium]
MKIFIDTANINEIEQALELGACDGVTTNPTLLAKEKGNPDDIYRAICERVQGPVCAEAISLEKKDIIQEGENLAAIADNMVVKIPASKDGLKAVRILESQGIRCNVTLVFSPMQALLAAKAGASFICPFVGRLDDASHDGMELIEQITHIYQNYLMNTEIMVASIRSVTHVRDAAMIGADIATIPLKVIEKLTDHPLTDKGIELFIRDWEKVQKQF